MSTINVNVDNTSIKINESNQVTFQPSQTINAQNQRIANLAPPVADTDATTVNWTAATITNNMDIIASTRVYRDSAFGLNGGVSVIEFAQITQIGFENSFSVELHLLSYNNDNFAALYHIQANSDETAGAWQIVLPNSSSYIKNDLTNLYPQLEIKITGQVMNLRVRRKNFVPGPVLQNMGYRIAVKSGTSTAILEFINQSGDPEPAVTYNSNVLNCRLADAIDTNITSAANAQPLIFNSATNKWVNNFIYPRLSAYFFNVQNLPSGSTTQLILDGVQWDTRGNYTPASGTFTVSDAGYYSVVLSSSINSTGSITSYITGIYQNGGLQSQGSFFDSTGSSNAGSVARSTVRCNIGDTITVTGLPNGSGTISLNFSTLSIDFLGPL